MISFGFILTMIATPSIVVLAQTNKTSEKVTTPLSSAGSTNASSNIAGGHISIEQASLTSMMWS